MSGFVIALIFTVLIVTVLAVFMGNINETYPSDTYDNDSIAVYNKLSNLTAATQSVQGNITTIKTSSGFFEISGRLLQGAYQSFLTVLTSFGVFQTISFQAVSDLRIGNPVISTLLRTAIISAVAILIFLGVIVAAIIKWRT